MPARKTFLSCAAGLAWLWLLTSSFAQVVCLPAPRLLTVMPMGGQAGTTFEVAVTGENIDEAYDLLFSNPKITSTAKLAADGQPTPGKFVVTIAADAPPGIHEARLMTRLGGSASRAFSVGVLPELKRDRPNGSAATALRVSPGLVCNSFVPGKAIDYYTFDATQGQRLIVDCAAAGIDSKLTAVLIVADAAGHELAVNRRGGMLDFTAPTDGGYFIKVHDLTYQGGESHFYRLALTEAAAGDSVRPQPSAAQVSSFSWTPQDRTGHAVVAEQEPNNKQSQAQQITLPCEIGGRFFPAADIDVFEFAARQGETWWVEVVSERLGLPTDSFVLVQRVETGEGAEQLVDVAELNDIASPVKVATGSANSYDGAPYNAGSADAWGELKIPADGRYRLQLRDLFGGTRNDPANVYRLIVRRAAPDFALIAWALHMETRNQDRAALSKPIALRTGGTMALEVVALRRDGFRGEIALAMEDLPAGTRAQGLKIPADKNRGIMLITAAENAPRSLAAARLVGRAQIDGAAVSRPCALAAMTWPVRDTAIDPPAPRLLADVAVSVGSESAPLSIGPSEDKVWQAKAGEKLTIPLRVTWRGEFTSPLQLRTFGAGFEAAKEIDVPVNAQAAAAVFDLAALHVPPGEYVVALYGSYTTRYRYNLAAVKAAEQARKSADDAAMALAASAKRLAEEAQAAPAEKKADAEAAAKRSKIADEAKATATARLKTATDAAAPTLISDIVVAEPLRILVTAADK